MENNAINKPASAKRKTSVVQTISFYGFYLIFVFIFGSMYPGGPCVPGLGIFLIMGLPYLSGILLLYNFISVARGNKANKVSLWIHLSVLIVFIALCWL